MNNQLLREIPKVDDLLRSPALVSLCQNAPRSAVADAVRSVLAELRSSVLTGEAAALPDEAALAARVAECVKCACRPSLRRTINGTGVILHTNLGRACLAEAAAAAVAEVARGYSTLEYDVLTGGRGERYSHVEALLTALTGAEAAFVVNNNAAAVLLILSGLAAGGEVVASRGELVEIGGSFRVPEIMESCGARLREVGTTNKTHLSDYERAIGPDTRALMKVHTSNFRIVGFTESVPRAEMAALGHAHNLAVIEDLGSGSLLDLAQFGIQGEPTVQDSVRAGVDVISFSGDKLLGGPQAGIIIGKKQYIDRLQRHPLTRAMRVDKLTLAALEATLRLYASGTAFEQVPTLAMLAAKPETLFARAEALARVLCAAGAEAEPVPVEDQVGGGSVPMQMLPSFAVSVSPAAGRSVEALEAALRLGEPPIIGRIDHGRYLLHVRTLRGDDFAAIANAWKEAAR